MKKMNFLALMIALLALSLPVAHAGVEESALILISIVNQNPDPGAAGDVVDVRLGIQNLGGRGVSNLVVELAPEYPFSLLAGESATQDVGAIQGYQGYYDANTKIIKYSIRVDKDAKAGIYDLKVRYYEEGSSVVSQKSVAIEVRSRESAEIIHIDKTLLVPGRQTSMKFTINNVGNAPLKELKFSWENADKIVLPVGSDNTRYIRYIEVGQSEEIEYNVIADTNAVLGLYQLDLYLTYEDSANGSEKTISSVAGVYVGGETDFEVSFSESSGGTMSFNIANVGSNPASSVSVIIPQQMGWSVSGSNSYMLGNLNKGDYTVASFALQSATANTTFSGNMNFRERGSAPGNFSQERFTQRQNISTNALTVQIAYTDTMGERHTVEKQVSVGSTGSAQGAAFVTGQFAAGSRQTFTRQDTSFFSQYGTYVAAVAALVLLVLARREYNKRKLMNPKYTFRQFIGMKKK